MTKKLVQNLLHKELSYALHGAAIEVRKDFGPGHKEKLYQEALVKELKRRNIVFEKEKAIKIYSPKDGQYIGLYRPDFIVDNKIIVEVKAEKFVKRDEFKRIYDYLRNSEYELAYFINFASPKLFVKRIIFTNNHKPMIKKLLVFISLILVLIGGVRAEAAQLELTSQIQEIGVGQQFQVDLLLDTENEEINAVEGKIIFPSELLELKEIRDGNSIINFWIERPINPLKDTNTNTNKHELLFSGITPGGYIGGQGLILSAIFQAKEEGRGAIEIREAKVLLNDGEGTEAKLQAKDLLVTISANISGISWASPRDAEPPEDFKPEIAQDPDMFDGKYFLVFVTQDKGSGIDRYEIQEIRNKRQGKNWVEAESPYVLKDQELKSYIYVKAIDKAGNERIAVVEPKYPLKWYENWWIWVIIIVLASIIFYIVKRFLCKKITH